MGGFFLPFFRELASSNTAWWLGRELVRKGWGSGQPKGSTLLGMLENEVDLVILCIEFQNLNFVTKQGK